MDDASDRLIAGAQRGERGAFDALIRRVQPRLLRLVRARMGPDLRHVEESDDVVQSALLAAVRDLDGFEYRGQGSFLRWLATIVERKILNHVRDLHRVKRDPAAVEPLPDVSDTPGLAAADPSPSDDAVGGELAARYGRALARVPPAERELLLLHLELRCSYQEIAAALALPSTDAVRKRIVRALALLERLMARSEP